MEHTPKAHAVCGTEGCNTELEFATLQESFQHGEKRLLVMPANWDMPA